MTDKPLLIALCSPAMGSGKSTVAAHLAHKYGFTVIRFAAPLKAMTRAFLREVGLSMADIEAFTDGNRKEDVIPGVPGDVTSRRFQQLLGTEFGRECIHPNLWVEIAMHRARGLLAAGKSVVIDDMRFPNELAGVVMAGGVALRVNRPSAAITSGHQSEGALDLVPMTEILNDRDLDHLHAFVDGVISHLKLDSNRETINHGY